MVVRRTVSVLDRVAQFFTPQNTTVLPATKDDRGRADSDARHGVAKPVTPEQTGSTGADLHARVDLALRDGLLELKDVEAIAACDIALAAHDAVFPMAYCANG